VTKLQNAHGRTSENSIFETVWKIVRVASGPYFSPRRGGKTGHFALLGDSWRCQYGSYPEFPNSFFHVPRRTSEIFTPTSFGEYRKTYRVTWLPS
jgi:hypothetical protein